MDGDDALALLFLMLALPAVVAFAATLAILVGLVYILAGVCAIVENLAARSGKHDGL